MEPVRNLKVNLKLDGQTCVACKTVLVLATDASVCTACAAPHHARCWTSYGGCATKGCANAPLPRLDPPAYPGYPGYPAYQAAAAPAPLPPGMMACPSCRYGIRIGEPICPYCRAITSPDGIYHGPRMNAPGAVSSMVLGIVGILVCGVVLGPIAISQASSAKRQIAMTPTYGGAGYATAGTVLGIIATAVWAIVFLASLAGGNR